MDRKAFIKVCGGTCLGWIGLSVLQSCHPTKHLQLQASNKLLRISKAEFRIQEKKESYRRSIICNVSSLDFPIVLYRFKEDVYSAVLLRCSHQSNELSMHGDILSCSAHGSEFGMMGEVLQGPAELPLQTYKVSSDNDTIYVHLT